MKTMTSFCETEEISADMWRHQTELYLFTIIIRRFRSQQIEAAVFNLNEVDLDTFKVSNDKIEMLTGMCGFRRLVTRSSLLPISS